MKYTQIPSDTFSKLQLNAGILLSTFTPGTGTFQRSDILGATSGGVSFSDTPEFVDFGDGIDNCPKNTKQLKKIKSREIKLSGTYLTLDTTRAKALMAAADIDSSDTTKVTARDLIKSTDFDNIWWVGDYSSVNADETGTTTHSAGFIAIKLCNALSTGGFTIQSADKDKGTVAFEFTAHYDIENPDTVPYELYIKAGT